MNKFKIGDEVRVKEDLEVGKIYNGIVFTHEMCINKCKKRTISERWTTQSGIMHYHLDFNPKQIFTGYMLELVENSEEVKTADFTKADLKDGMVVTFRNGDKHYVIKNGTEIQDTNTDLENWCIKYVYTKDLIHYPTDYPDYSDINYDIMQVSYMGEVLWKRKELYTLGEIYEKWKKGEVIKYTLIQGPDFITDLYNVWGKINDVYCYDRKIKYATERIWEIVE